MSELYQLLKHPSRIVIALLFHLGGWMNDRLYLKMLYKAKTGHKLNLNTPQRFTEKLQWLKLYNRCSEYTSMVDKYEVKRIVAERIGEKYVIPTLGVWDKPEDIEWDILPKQFVLKTTHGGGSCGVVICQDMVSFDRNVALVKLRENLGMDIYRLFREWPYKDVPRRIIAEQYLSPPSSASDLPDYKFYCFNGEPKILLVASNRSSTHNFNYFDMDYNPLPYRSCDGDPIPPEEVERTAHFEEMKEIAKMLSKGIPHVRVDLYDHPDHPFFGELTFFDSSGFDTINSDEIDRQWGDWLKLPNNK